MPDEATSLAQRYVLETPIAEGGMATVWRARDDVLARPVTVKILHHELGIDPGFIESFKTEALAAARLAHPNIVAIYDTGSEGAGEETRHFIVMEHCGGGSLADLLRREGVLDISAAYRVAADICAALEHAHRQGVIHRDIKPENILFSDQGTVKVGDFGIARSAFASGDVDTTTSLLGNVTYISPEQALGREADERSDIYSLGALLYRCLVGRPPFEKDTAPAVARAHIKEDPPPLRSIRAHVPRGVDATILRALEKDPADRYDSVGELLHAFRNAADPASTQVLRRPARPPRRRPPPRRVPSRRLLAGAFAAGALVALAALVMNRSDVPPDSPPAGQTQEEEREANRIEVREVTDLDPYGDGSEHPDEAHLAADGDPSTMWTTQRYDDPLSLFKPGGLGLRFDLGSPQEIQEVEIAFDEAGYMFELRSSLSPGESDADHELVAEITAGEQTHLERFDRPREGRFWLVWIKNFPGNRIGRGAIAEVRFFGP